MFGKDGFTSTGQEPLTGYEYPWPPCRIIAFYMPFLQTNITTCYQHVTANA